MPSFHDHGLMAKALTVQILPSSRPQVLIPVLLRPLPLPVHPQTQETKEFQWKKCLKYLSYHHVETSRKNIFCSLCSRCKFPLPLVHWTLESGSYIHVGSDTGLCEEGLPVTWSVSSLPAPHGDLPGPSGCPQPRRFPRFLSSYPGR